MNDPDSPAPPRFGIVGIGASAGGLAALETFFEQVPERSGLAFVVVVHLAAEHESHLPSLLQPHVSIPVEQVTDTVAIEPDHVYVIPPGRNLEAVDTHLRVSTLEEYRRDRAPIDHFLRTLAKTQDGVAIGVILSGTGSDGTLGIKEIKQVGGLAVVQDPLEAEYDGMPQSAIATGLVDLILPVGEIPAAILRYVRTQPSIPVPDDDEDVGAEELQLLRKLFAQIRGRTGRDFSRYKRSTILRRIQRRMQLHQIERLDDYLDYVRLQPEEARAISDDFLVTVTNFFRDPEVFLALEKSVIPLLFTDKKSEDHLRVWSVGCATGEEAYSLAILLVEEAARVDSPPHIQLFASDLHERSLRVAREGLYPGNIEADVSPERLARFFTKQSGGYRVRQEIRDLVVFAPHNLLSDPPFSKIDLISCRNLLIYLQREVQRDVVELFHYALRPEGFLVLGTSETVGRTDLFRVEHKKNCFFRRRNVPTRDPRLPVFTLAGGAGPISFVRRQAEPPVSYAILHTQMVERHAPPSLLINQDHEVVHFSAGAGRYMRVPGGEPTSSVFKLLREELRLELRTALHVAEKERRSVRTEPVVVALDGTRCEVVVEVSPAEETQHDGFALLVFEESPESTNAQREAVGVEPDAGTREMGDELVQTKQRLQGLIEKYETGQEEMRGANEELQSANEELRSTMEELETSKEELQSMNEELATLNQENRHKVEELSELSSDLQNLMAATDIATLFLDREQRILRFTPRIEELFNVRLGDRGRPLSDLTHRLRYAELGTDAKRVLNRLTPIEREVQDQSGRWYLARLLPYRTTRDRIGGVVLTLIEITERKLAEEALRARAETDAFRLALTDAIRPLVDPLEVQTSAARMLGEHFGASRVFYAEIGEAGEHGEVRTGFRRGVAPIIGDYRFEDHGPELVEDLRASRTVVVTDVDHEPRLREPEREQARELDVAAFVTVPVVKHGQLIGVFVVQQSGPRVWTSAEVALTQESVDRMWSTAERVQAAAALAESEQRYRTLFESSDEGFCIIEMLFDDAGAANDYRYCVVNPAFEKQTGIKNAVGRRMRELAPGHDQHWFDTYGRVAKTGDPIRFQAPADALGRFYDVYAFRVGRPEERRIAVLFNDITKRKQLEDQLRELADELSMANQRKDEFLATLAHELRNPLAPITSALALLRQPNNPVPVADIHAVIERQVVHMVRIVEDLLDVSRITRGVVELRKQPVDLADIMRRAVETSRPLLELGGRKVSVELGAERLVVDGDPARLIQVVSNLLNNAAKYTDEGGRIWLTIGRAGERARISVRDDGVGIPEHMLERVFDMFAQVDDGRTNGLGVGLTLVRSLIRLHGGDIEVYSEGVGRGSEFVIRLPLVSRPAQALPNLGSEPVSTTTVAAQRMLVVDDNHDAADSLARLLESLGAEIRVAYDGPTALELFREWQPELVALDLAIPDMDGYQIARAIRELPGGDAVRIVAVTGCGQEADRQRSREAGFDEHLLKPVAVDQLVELLERRSGSNSRLVEAESALAVRPTTPSP